MGRRLAFLMALAVAGCGSKPQPDIVGTWTTDLNSKPELWDRFTFNADGTLVWKWHFESKRNPSRSNDTEQKGTYKVSGETIELDLGPSINTNPRYKPDPAQKDQAKIMWISKDQFMYSYNNGSPIFYRVK